MRIGAVISSTVPACSGVRYSFQPPGLAFRRVLSAPFFSSAMFSQACFSTRASSSSSTTISKLHRCASWSLGCRSGGLRSDQDLALFAGIVGLFGASRIYLYGFVRPHSGEAYWLIVPMVVNAEKRSWWRFPSSPKASARAKTSASRVGGSGRVAYRRGGGGSRGHTPRVLAVALTGAYARREVVTAGK